jgi:hypothetical protein
MVGRESRRVLWGLEKSLGWGESMSLTEASVSCSTGVVRPALVPLALLLALALALLRA